MKRTRFQRIVTLMLCLAFVLSGFSVTAYATDSSAAKTGESSDSIYDSSEVLESLNTISYAQYLKDAMAQEASGSIVVDAIGDLYADKTTAKYQIINADGKDALKAYWDSEFSSILPGDGENVSDVSEWRFNYFWNYYKMDDVIEGIYHGKVTDYTDEMLAYVAKMENDVDNNPERQGCVAVTRELAEILDTLIAREVFEDVQNGWLKFCYYYNILGETAE